MIVEGFRHRVLGAVELPPVIVQAISRCRGHFVWALAFSFFINLLFLAPPLYMLQIYDRVVPTGGVETLLFLTLALALALVTMAALDAIRLRLLVRASLQLDEELSPLLLERSVGGRAPPAQSMRDFDTVRSTIASPAFAALFDLPYFPIFVLVAFMLHFWIGVVATLAAALILGIAYVNQRSTRGSMERATRRIAAVHASTQAAAVQSDTINAMGMGGKIAARALSARADAIATFANAQFAGTRFTAASKFVRLFVQSLALGIGALLAIEGKMSFGGIIAASIIVGRALQPIDAVIGGWGALNSALASLKRLAATLANELLEKPSRMQLPPPVGKLSVSRVALKVGNAKPILFGVSFEVAPGECLAVIGPSGAGKSTLAKAIVGSIAVNSGEIRIDGAQLSDWDPGELGQHIGYVPQNPALFEGSIRDNICRFDDSSDHREVDAKVIRAATAARVHDLILGLPKGYDTKLGALGGGFSAGQAQRIALARALYGDPALLVLDEPNSNLDAQGDAALAEAILDVRKRGGAVLLVAHRRSILAVATHVLILESGSPKALGEVGRVLAKLQAPANSESAA